jgi:WD40 repeat protein
VLVALLALGGAAALGLAQEKSEEPDSRFSRLMRDLEAARKDPARAEYHRRIARAEETWRNTGLEQAKQILDDCAPEMRGWEWHYLRRLFESGARALPGRRCVALSPDGKRVAAADGPSVKVWDLKTGQAQLAFNGHSREVLAVAFSRDGKRLVSAGADQSAIVWDAATGKPVVTLRGHKGSIGRLAINPGGTRVATASDDGSAKVWGLATGKEVVTFSGHRRPVVGIAFSHDGGRVATADGDGVKVWDAESGQVAYSVEGRQQAVAFSPDGGSLAVGGRGDTVQVLEARTGKQRYTIGRFSEAVCCLAFTPDGKGLVAGFAVEAGRPAGRIRLWDASDGVELLAERDDQGPITDVAFGPDATLLGTAGPGRTVRVWNFAREGDATTFQRRMNRINDLSVSPDGKWIAATPAVYLNKGFDKIGLRMWEAGTGKEVLLEKPRNPYWVGPVTFSPDSARIAFGNGEKVEVWDIGAQKKMVGVGFTWGDHVSCLAFSADGKRIAAGTSGFLELPRSPHELRIWDAGSGKQLLTLRGHDEGVFSVAFSHDGRSLATGGNESAQLWEARTGKERFSLKCANNVSAVAFSPDGQRLATAGGVYFQRPKEMTVWDVATGKALYTVSGEPFWPNSVDWSPDGRRLAVGSFSGGVKVIDTASGQVVLTLPFKYNVARVAFSPDGARLYVAGDDRQESRICYWDATPTTAKK